MITDGEIRLEPIGEEHLEGLAALGHDPLVRQNTRVPDPLAGGFERTGSRPSTADANRRNA